MIGSSISVIIPNWNGAALLERYLPAVLAELKDYAQSECIVVDDGSTDGSASLVESNFAGVRLIQKSQNRGFSSAINAGIAAAKHDLLLLLNNDVRITAGFLGNLLTVFDESSDTFAVASMQRQDLPDGQVVLDGFNTLHWRAGHFDLENCTTSVLEGQRAALAYCNAGCSLFSKKKLVALGGFSELFDPFYFEDAEVSMQAARRGWRLAFAPASVVEHHHGTSSRRKPWRFRFVPVRNYFFLHWLLLDTPLLWRQHIAGVGLRLIGWTIQGRIRYLVGFLLALAQTGKVISERRRRARGVVRSTAALIRECGYESRF